MTIPVSNKNVTLTPKNTQKPTQKKTGILLVAYGSSHMQATFAVRSFQARLEKDFALPVRLAFTSETMRKRLAHAKTKSDSVLKALEKMYFERFTHVAVQTLHLIPGMEYHDVLGDIELARDKMPLKVEAGAPLLSKSSDVPLAAKALQALIPEEFAENDLLLWMGHGSEHEAESYYNEIAEVVHALDSRLFIACMEGTLTLETILTFWKSWIFNNTSSSTSSDLLASSAVCTSSDTLVSSHFVLPTSDLKEVFATQIPQKVWLLPLLTTIGRHALHDMAGSQESSWKSQLEKAGYTCQVHMHGLAESHFIQDIWIERLKSALARL